MAKTRAIWRLTIEQAFQNGTIVLAPSGRLGHVAAGDLQRAIDSAVAAGVRYIVVDLTEVDYVSSRALLIADAAADRLRAQNGKLVLCGLSDPVCVTLEVAGWIDRFLVEATREHALAVIAVDVLAT
jgi:anti-anti-sigma factor